MVSNVVYSMLVKQESVEYVIFDLALCNFPNFFISRMEVLFMYLCHVRHYSIVRMTNRQLRFL